MGLVRTAAPAALIELADAKIHLRVDEDQTNEDTLIEIFAEAAVDRAQLHLGRAILAQTWDYTLDSFPVPWACATTVIGLPAQRTDFPTRSVRAIPSVIRLPLPSLLSVESIEYLDENGQPQTLDPSAYIVDVGALPGTVSPAPGFTWPATRAGVPIAVRVSFTCGFSDDPDEVPAAIKAACLLILGDLYVNREAQIVGTIVADNATVTALLGGYVFREAV